MHSFRPPVFPSPFSPPFVLRISTRFETGVVCVCCYSTNSASHRAASSAGFLSTFRQGESKVESLCYALVVKVAAWLYARSHGKRRSGTFPLSRVRINAILDQADICSPTLFPLDHLPRKGDGYKQLSNERRRTGCEKQRQPREGVHSHPKTRAPALLRAPSSAIRTQVSVETPCDAEHIVP